MFRSVPIPSQQDDRFPTHSQDFVYPKLATKCFRTLVLFSGASDHWLEGRLEQCSLSDDISYRAISYVWGDPTLTRRLYTPSGIIRITESLFAALVNFRSTTQSVRLWADGICIDQCSEQEKAQQVSIMGEIYRGACEVLVYLGPSASTDTLAFWALDIFAEFYCLPHIADLPVDISKRNPQAYRRNRGILMCAELDAHRSCGRRSYCCECCLQPHKWPPGDFKTAVFQAILRIWQQSWWRRLWTLQEVVLTEKATFYLGQHHASLETIDHAVGSWYETYDIVQGDIEAKEEHYVLAGHAYRLFRTIIMPGRRGDKYCPRQCFLQHLLLPSCYDVKTTFAKDIVHATRALTLAATEDSLHPGRQLAAPELWKEVTLSLIKDRKNAKLPAATILAIVGTQHTFQKSSSRPARDPSLPSWVCDIQACGPEAWRKYVFYLQDGHKRRAGGPVAQMEVECVGEGIDALSICGYRWSRVSDTLKGSQRSTEVCLDEDPQEPSKQAQLPESLMAWYLRCRKYAFSQRTVYPNLKATFAKLLTHGRDFGRSLARRKEWQESLQAVIEDIDWALPAYHAVDAEVGRGQIATDLAPFLHEKFKSKPYDRTRMLAMTESGHLGWIPEVAVVGDWVCLLKGAPYPFILRDVHGEDGCFVLIGDAYIHGISQGEAWPANEKCTESLFLI